MYFPEGTERRKDTLIGIYPEEKTARIITSK